MQNDLSDQTHEEGGGKEEHQYCTVIIGEHKASKIVHTLHAASHMPPPPKSSKKRRRSSGPGTPPESLLRLLRENAAVLEFFQHLQASLEEDVQIQKDRAQAALEENERLRAEMKELRKKAKQRQQPASKRKNGATAAATRKPRKTTASKSNTTKKNSDECDGESDTKKPAAKVVQKERPTLAQLQAESAPIVDDSFFDLSDEDDVSSLSADEAMMGVSESAKLPQDAMNDAAEAEKEQNEMIEDRKEIFCFLKEAHDILAALRISTVLREEPAISTIEEEKKDDTEGQAADEQKDEIMDDRSDDFGFGSVADEKKSDNNKDDNKPASAPVRRILGRKSDESVVTDILDRIKSNSLLPPASSKLELLDYARGEVFTLVASNDDDLVPTCNPSSSTMADHPLLRGKRLLLRVLILLDTFCSPSVSTSEWDSLFDETILDTVPLDTVKAMQLGLRNRKVVVDRLLAYWDGSVSERWAWYDRSLRLTAQHVKYIPSERDDENPAVDLKGDGTNNCSWLWTLPGRAVFAQCTTFLHLLRQENDTAARNVIEYVLSTSPALPMEDHPELPPVMSFVTLESLLLLPDTELRESYLDIAASDDATCWFRHHLSSTTSAQRDSQREVLLRSVALAVHCVAFVWKQRLASWDEKIHDVASVELAAHKRLLESREWLRYQQHPQGEASSQDTMDLREMVRLHVNDLLQISTETTVDGDNDETNKGGVLYYNYAMQIALVLHGDRRALQTVVNDGIHHLDDESWTHARNIMLRHSLVNLSRVGRHLALRELDTHRRQIGVSNNDMAPMMDMCGLFRIVWEKRHKASRIRLLALLCTFLQCSVVLADGNTALRVTQELVNLQGDFENVTQLIYESVRHASEIPQVRVINLERRSDRMKAFMSQAAREHLLVVKAVAILEEREELSTDNETPLNECYEFGDYAIDGIGRLVEANKNLSDRLGSVERLDKVVATHWRPNDLKAFDKDAPDSEHLVRATPTERACALSHVASWKGALRSMKIASTVTEASSLEASVSKLFRHPQHTLRLFKIGGFAQGPALLPKNDRMPPAPVCVILEDDAVLEDRFAEKLANVLKELPRDFHFCSIGYSRPKSAPIVPFGDKIGIPTMLWYLTGYCISEAGAKYLLESLPVTGPVDSWIGLKMTSNWDNIYGCRLGVGAHANPNAAELPARKDLRKILDFRAFCSLHPLCSQKIKVDAAVASAGTVVAASTARTWRQRDTDIVYSGSAMAAAEQTTTRQR